MISYLVKIAVLYYSWCLKEKDLHLCLMLIEFAEKKSHGEKETYGNGHSDMTTATSTDQDGNSCLKVQPVKLKTDIDDNSSACQSEHADALESNSDSGDIPDKRPMSPGTLALMCDEQDTMLMAQDSPSTPSRDDCSLPYGKDMADLYAEQEKVVLTTFRDFLQKVVTCGKIKGRIDILHHTTLFQK